MKAQELYELFLQGEDLRVEYTENFDFAGTDYIKNGIRCKIVKIEEEIDSRITFYLNFEAFDTHNEKVSGMKVKYRSGAPIVYSDRYNECVSFSSITYAKDGELDFVLF